MVKSQYKHDLHCSGYKEKTATQLYRRVLQDFAFQYISYFKTGLHLARLKQYPKANRPENNEPDQQTCNLVSSGVILLLGYRRYCGSFLRKWQWKIIPFQVHRVFSQRKILMIRILILILSRIVLKKCCLRYFQGVVSIDFKSLLENPISVSASNGNSYN